MVQNQLKELTWSEMLKTLDCVTINKIKQSIVKHNAYAIIKYEDNHVSLVAPRLGPIHPAGATAIIEGKEPTAWCWIHPIRLTDIAASKAIFAWLFHNPIPLDPTEKAVYCERFTRFARERFILTNTNC